MAVADVASASSEPTVSVSTRRQPRRLPWLTTPGWFRLAAVVLLAGLVALAVVSVGAALGRGDATAAVRDDATPLLVGAEDLYVALADADAAASTAFLRAGLEPEELRARYLDDLETAGASWRSSRRGRVTRRRRAKPWAGSPRSCRCTPARSSRPARTTGWTIRSARPTCAGPPTRCATRCSPPPPASTRRPPAASTTRTTRARRPATV